MSNLTKNSSNAKDFIGLVRMGLTYEKLESIAGNYEETRKYGIHPSDWICRYITRENQAEYVREGMEEASEICKKIKWYSPEETRTYKIWGWGYDQTNYENLNIVGETGSYLIGEVNGYNYYKIPKKMEGSGAKRKDGSIKDYYKIDDVRITSWEKPYSSKQIFDQENYNMAYGH